MDPHLAGLISKASQEPGVSDSLVQVLEQIYSVLFEQQKEIDMLKERSLLWRIIDEC